MEMQPVDIGPWLAYIIPAVLTFLGALITTMSVLGRKIWVGIAHYAEKGWNLIDRIAHKHMEFIDNLSAQLGRQTQLLEEIKQGTDDTVTRLDNLGSDPTGAVRIQALIDELKKQPDFCRYSHEELEKRLQHIIDTKVTKIKRAPT